MTPYYQDEGITIYHGMAADVMGQLADESVDLVFTDPPYPREFDAVWDDLAAHAPRLLRTGKSLLTYLGHYQLPRVLDAFDGQLRYNWLCVQRNHGATPRMFGPRAMVSFKPVLWFTKGPIERGPMMSDELSFVPKGMRDKAKRLHEWGQPLSYLPIVTLTSPGETVLDPFAGSGTTLMAAKDAGRLAIGIEMDERHCETAALRCSQGTLGLSA